MDETISEFDSFTAEMLRRVKEHKKHFDALLHSSDDDDDVVSPPEDNENDNANNNHDQEENGDGCDADGDDLLSILEMNDNYKAHVRKSISALLNVHESVLPSDEEAEPDNNEKVATSRLNQRLNKLSQLYTDSVDVSAPTRNVLIEKNVNINNKESQNLDNNKPPKRLKDKLNDIARFYYPVHDEPIVPKSKSPVKLPQVVEPKAHVESTTSVVNKKPTKVSEMIERMNSQPEVVQPPTKSQVSCPLPSPQIPVQKQVSSSENKMPQEVLTKKTSVADLKKMFEDKAKDDSQQKPEVAPELLSLREKRRLFEKAIRNESENCKNQYRKQLPPPKRLGNWEPIAKEESAFKRPKNASEIENETAPTETVASSKEEAVVVQPQTLNRFNSECMSVCSVIKSEILYPEHGGCSDVDEEKEEENVIDLVAADNSKQESFQELANLGENTAQESVKKAFEAIDNYSMSCHEESNLESIDDITFSALESNEQMQRSSTKMDLKSGSQSCTSSSLELPPEKPARLYLYENDEPESDIPIPITTSTATTNDPPPLRTISFYRREQKMRKETCESPAAGSSGSQATTVIHLKQKLIEDQAAKLDEFKKNCNERIAALKAEISEHNRISGQASTALNMCLTHHDLEFNEGRVEAERLLLISAQKRQACTAEIQRIKNMMVNPEKYSSQYANVTSKGMVSISNLRIPLRNEFVDSRAKGKVASSFYFICLVFNGPKVFVSELLNSEKNAGKDHLDFNFNLHCQELNEDFSIRIQLFALELNKDKSKKDSIGRKSFRVKFGTSSLKRTDKGSVGSPIPEKIMNQSSSFKPIGQVVLDLATVRKPPSFYRMESLTMSSPIDGYIIMDVSLRVNHDLSAEGYFDLQDSNSSFWNLRWFALNGDQLMFWRFLDDVNEKEPIGVINLKHCINPKVALLKGDQREVCMRQNTFVLVTTKPPAVSNAHKLVNGGTIVRSVPQKFFISSHSKEEIQFFCDQIGRLLRNIRVWENDAVRPYSPDEFNRILLDNHS